MFDSIIFSCCYFIRVRFRFGELGVIQKVARIFKIVTNQFLKKNNTGFKFFFVILFTAVSVFADLLSVWGLFCDDLFCWISFSGGINLQS